MTVRGYAKYLLIMAGLGGLLYGIDVGVVDQAYPYLLATSNYSKGQLGFVVGAVLWGSVISSLFAGQLTEWMGRRMMIFLSSLCFTLSIPVICASGWFEGGNFALMVSGRLLQGVAGGFLGVVVPMYLAECLDADSRGKGTGMFQLLLTVGIVFSAVVGLVVAYAIGNAEDPSVPMASKITAWQLIFWCSAIPGLILSIGAFKLRESPRWLYYRGRRDDALASLAANNGEEKAKAILDEMIAADKAAEAEKAAVAAASKGESLLQRKYVIPFVLAVLVLTCNQTTGVNSVLNYATQIFKESGLEGALANWGSLGFKVVNMVMTIVACALVDKKGRTFLLKLGTSGIVVGLLFVGGVFLSVERGIIAPSMTTGVFVLVGFVMFIASFAVGPGVCVWLALSELMPTRIRANGMAIALVINQGTSALIATAFPKWSAAVGYGWVFVTLALFTVFYFIVAAFFLPETKGRTLEEIEKYFKTGKMP
jgi:sugar porter (SP) family MFS transporter